MSRGFFEASVWKVDIDKPGLPRCGECGLLNQCQSPKMPPYGRGKHPILIVGEAPGEQEDERGRPFIGKSGDMLREVFMRFGVHPDDCKITNTISCRPPQNQIEQKHINACRPLLLASIQKFQPKVILCVGGHPTKAIVSAEYKRDWGGVGAWVGKTIPSQRFKAWVCPTWHPSYLMRMGGEKKAPVLFREFAESIRVAIARSKQPLPDNRWMTKNVEALREVSAVAMLREIAARGSGEIAFDYETNRLKPESDEARVLSVSVCDGADPKRAWATMMTDKVRSALKAVLLNPNIGKIGANIKFEHRWSRFLGIQVNNWTWDTMTSAHVIDNRDGITSLKYQAYVMFGIAGYETVFASTENKEEVPVGELLRYNAIDSLLTYHVAQRQRKEISSGASR